MTPNWQNTRYDLSLCMSCVYSRYFCDIYSVVVMGWTVPQYHTNKLQTNYTFWRGVDSVSYQYRNFYYKDKMVTWLSNFSNGNPCTGNTASLYWIGPLVPPPPQRIRRSCTIARTHGCVTVKHTRLCYWISRPANFTSQESPCVSQSFCTHPCILTLITSIIVYKRNWDGSCIMNLTQEKLLVITYFSNSQFVPLNCWVLVKHAI